MNQIDTKYQSVLFMGSNPVVGHIFAKIAPKLSFLPIFEVLFFFKKCNLLSNLFELLREASFCIKIDKQVKTLIRK